MRRLCVRGLEEAEVPIGKMTWAPTTGEGHANRLSIFLRSSRSKNVMPSRTTRGYRMPEVNGCRGASWIEELDDKELRGALGGERDLELKGCAVS